MVSTRNKRKNGKDGLFVTITQCQHPLFNETAREEHNLQFDTDNLIKSVELYCEEYLSGYGIDFKDNSNVEALIEEEKRLTFEARGVVTHYHHYECVNRISDREKIKALRLVISVINTVSTLKGHIKNKNFELALTYAMRLTHQYRMFTIGEFEDEICAGRLRYDVMVEEKVRKKEERKEQVMERLPMVVSTIKSRYGKVTRASVYQLLSSEFNCSEETIKRYLRGVDIKSY